MLEVLSVFQYKYPTNVLWLVNSRLMFCFSFCYEGNREMSNQLVKKSCGEENVHLAWSMRFSVIICVACH